MAATLQRLGDGDEGARPRSGQGNSKGGVSISTNESALASSTSYSSSCLGASATPTVAGAGVLSFLTSIGFGPTERSRLRKALLNNEEHRRKRGTD